MSLSLHAHTTRVCQRCPESFFKTPGKGINYARIAYVLEIPELEKALKCLAEGLRQYPGRTI